MAKTSPTKRTLDALRARGLVCQVTEIWNPFARRRIDLFGGLDILALDVPGRRIIGVQCTTVANQAARIAKLKAEPRIQSFMDAGGKVECWGWAKKLSNGRGSRRTWQATITELNGDAE